MAKLPRYPIYIPSKGRASCCLTAKFLVEDGVPFKLVVEPEEYDEYIHQFGKASVLKLPFHYIGEHQLPTVRNFIKEHSKANGDIRHWIIDDNIDFIERRYKANFRLRCPSGLALALTEDFTERYLNVAVSGLAYSSFAPSHTRQKAFRVNCHVYSCFLILNSTPHKWRGPKNEDVDMCLQVLADNWCIIQMNLFLIKKRATMTMKGGCSDTYAREGRLKLSRDLERRWPGVVTVGRRHSRPHHIIKDQWTHFDTQLIRNPAFDFDNLNPNEYGMELIAVDDVKSSTLRSLMKGKA